MYAVKQGLARVDDVLVDTFSRKLDYGDSQITVEAGTTGFSDADDDKAGTRCLVSIRKNKGDFYAGVSKNKQSGGTDGIDIAVSGNDAIYNLIRALMFAAEALTDQITDIDE